MSQQSSSSGVDLRQARFHWDLRVFETFQVELSEEGEDLIYHFWPPGELTEFSAQFGEELQDSFRHAFRRQPKDDDGFPKVDVQADYTSYEDSKTRLALGAPIPVKATAPADQPAEALATFHVRVVGWASNPMADQLLKDDLLSRLDTQVQAHDHQEDHPQRRPGQEAERDAPRRRKRRRRKRQRRDVG